MPGGPFSARRPGLPQPFLLRPSGQVASGGLGWQNNAAGGTSGTAVTSGNSGGLSGTPWDATGGGTGSTCNFDNTHAAHGTLAYKLATGSTATNVSVGWGGIAKGASEFNGAATFLRACLYFPALPGTTWRLWDLMSSVGVVEVSRLQITSAGLLQATNGSGTALFTFTTPVPAGQWVRVEGLVIPGGSSNGYVEIRLFTGLDSAIPAEAHISSTANLGTGGGVDTITFGTNALVSNYLVWMDDLAVSNSTWWGPVSPAPPPGTPPSAQVFSRPAPRARLGMFGSVAAGILAAVAPPVPPGVAAPSVPLPAIAHPAPHRAIPVAKGILVPTTFAPQPASVAPARPQPSLQHLPAHRGTWRGLTSSAALPHLTAKLPPSAVSRQYPHKPQARWLPAKTTFSPQPSQVLAPHLPPVIGHPTPHRATAKGIFSPTMFSPQPSAVPPAHVQPVIQHSPPHRATGKGILAKTTFSPQPATVPPAHVQPAIGHPAPHRVIARQNLAAPQQPHLTAPLPPTAVSARPAHRAVAKGVLAATTYSPQPSRVAPPQWRQPNAPRPAHRAVWRALAGPAPSVVVVTAVAPARPQPVTNRPPAPHRALARWLAAKTTFSPQPSTVPVPHWQPQPRTPASHRAAWRVLTGPAAVPFTTARLPQVQRRPGPHGALWRAVAGPQPPPTVTATPARPPPTASWPPVPHRATGKGILARATLAPQPSRIPAPLWHAQPRYVSAHRAAWRAVSGPLAIGPFPGTVAATDRPVFTVTAADQQAATVVAADALAPVVSAADQAAFTVAACDRAGGTVEATDYL